MRSIQYGIFKWLENEVIATYETSMMVDAPIVDTVARLNDLELRLSRGMAIIDERLAEGLPVERYEEHWFGLLHEYESLYGAQVQQR